MIDVDLILTKGKNMKNMKYQGSFDELYLAVMNATNKIEFINQDGYSVLIPADDIRFATYSKEQHDVDEGTDKSIEYELDKAAPEKSKMDSRMKQEMTSQERDAFDKSIDELFASINKDKKAEKKKGDGKIDIKKEDFDKDPHDVVEMMQFVNYAKYQLRRQLALVPGFSTQTIDRLADKYCEAIVYVATEIEGDFAKWGLFDNSLQFIADVAHAAAEVFGYVMNHDGDTSMDLRSIMISTGQEYFQDKFGVRI